jgi:hypothetical protein
MLQQQVLIRYLPACLVGPTTLYRCLSGKVVAMACEPQPLQMTAPAGLSRTQFLIASHAVGLPLFPSVCGDHGGLVSSWGTNAQSTS